MKSDIEISHECNILNINEIASKLNINDNYLEQYGKYKAKIDLDKIGDKLGGLFGKK